jgi:hypothetical protein
MTENTILIGAMVTLLVLGGLAWLIWRARRRFDAMVRGEVGQLIAMAQAQPPLVFSESLIADLPAPVQRCFHRNMRAGEPFARFVRLRHRGGIATAPGRPLLPLVAEQYGALGAPNYLWRARMRPARALWIDARDYFMDGRGGMLIKLVSITTLDDARGEKIDQGALVRAMIEITLLPGMLLPSDWLAWEAIDQDHARMRLTSGELAVEGVLTFNDAGDIVQLDAMRYRGTAEASALEPWRCTVASHAAVAGKWLPEAVQVTWLGGEAPFTYYDCTLFDFTFDEMTPF